MKLQAPKPNGRGILKTKLWIGWSRESRSGGAQAEQSNYAFHFATTTARRVSSVLVCIFCFAVTASGWPNGNGNNQTAQRLVKWPTRTHPVQQQAVRIVEKYYLLVFACVPCHYAWIDLVLL